MLLLTDCTPDALAALLPSSGATPSAAGPLAAHDRALWHALGGTTEPQRGVLSPGGPADFWSRLCVVADAPGSQFDVLRASFPAGIGSAAPVACLALTGRDFHGHRGRPWLAAVGNLHLSVAFVPGLAAHELLPALVMLPAVALVAAVSVATGGAVRPGIKWVNDVLWSGRKIGGVLTTTSTRGASALSAVLGIGLNVGCAPAVPPTPFVPEVGALAASIDPPPSLGQLLWPLLAELARSIDQLQRQGPELLWQAYREASLVIGRDVRVYDESTGERDPATSWPEPLARGVVQDIAPDLGLRLVGQAEPTARGRLAFESACRRFGL
jgi:biotin-(acetyl-CoA carboxylase) ligase